MRNATVILFTGLLLMPASLGNGVALAEIKVIDADYTYALGDNDSKVNARRVATQEAQRKALELAGTYVESLTVVRNYELSKDEVKAYTAGIVQTQVVADETRGTVDHLEVYIKARCAIDTDAVAKAIDRYRENEDLKEQLTASAQENNDLRKERDTLVKQLAAEKDRTKASETRKKLDTVLSQEEANNDTRTVWINIGPKLMEADQGGGVVPQADLDKSSVILQQAIAANPRNQQARILLASIQERNGNFEAAERELRAAIALSPSNPVAHMRLAVLLRTRGRNEEALKELHFVERLRPRNPMMLFHTGMTLTDMRRCGHGVQYLHRFLREKQSNRYPKKRELALEAISECGDARRMRRNRQPGDVR